MKIPPLCENFSQSEHVQEFISGTFDSSIKLKLTRLVTLSIRSNHTKS